MGKKISVIPVESNVPFPDDAEFKYPWGGLQIGDSFVFPENKRNSVASSATRYGKRTGKKFKIRKIEGNQARIWRVK